MTISKASTPKKLISFNSMLWKLKSIKQLWLALFFLLPLSAYGQTLISITNPPPQITASVVGDSQFWPNAGTINGVPISLRATLTSISAGDSIRLQTVGDNPTVVANTGTLAATVVWEAFDAATGAVIVADPDFLITDIDGNNGNPIESVSAACAGLSSFTTNGNFLAGCNANTNAACNSNIRVSESGGSILGEGTQGQNGSQQEGYIQYSWDGVTEWTVNYFATTGGRFYIHDADGDIPFDGTEILVSLVDLATIKGVTSTSLTSPAQGELITYQIDLSNAGPEVATGVNFTDILPAGVTYVSDTTTTGSYNPVTGAFTGGTIAVGGVETVTITALVNAAAGTEVTNLATTALADQSICSSRDDLEFSFIVAETPAPELTITKSVSTATSFSQAGDTLSYSYLVTNTGNVNIENVVPTDAGPTFNGAAATNALVGFVPPSATITPGNSQVFTATYLLDQVDVDNMAQDANPLAGIDNTASATGVPTDGTLPTVPSSTVETGFAPAPSLSILKEVSGATSFSQAGDTITYQYTVTNDGNITIDNVIPTDSGPTFNGAAAAGTLSGFSPVSASITPGANQVFNATYVLQQTDVDNMSAAGDPLTAIDNSAAASGDPIGATPLPTVTPSTAETGFAPDPSMTVIKSVSAATTFAQVGDVITYEYSIENTGNVTINNAVPTDAGPTFNGIAGTNTLSAFTPLSANIAPTDPAVVFTATYVLSQQDIDNMSAAADTATAIDNTASAVGTPTGGTLPTVPDSTAETGFVIQASLAVDKIAGAPTIGLGANSAATDASDTITYSFEVTNDGDVTIDSIVVNDTGPTFNGVAGTGSLSIISCPLTSLIPGQMTTCTASYTLSQGDVDNAVIGGANAIENSATASGEDPSDNSLSSPSDSATQTIASDSSITMNKSAGAPTVTAGTDPTIVDPDDTITYQLAADNTGNTTLIGVVISDSIATVTCPTTTNLGVSFVNDGSSQLAVGDGIVCTAIYTLLQSDLDNGGVQNTADVTSTDPTGATISDDDSVNSGFTQTASVSLIKSATPLPNPATAGDPITYTFELTNTGNVTLSAPQVTDPICETPGSPLTFTSGFVSGDAGVAGVMEAGETWVFECIYTIDQDDVNLGEVANTATGTGTPPASSGLPAPENTASNLANAEQIAAIALDKSSSLPTIAAGALSNATDVGDTVEYSFTVENTGNVTLNNIIVTDPFITGAPNNGTINCPAGIASLAPNAVVICTASYSVTQTDIDAGTIVNDANATGTPPPSVPPVDAPEADSSNMVTIAPLPDLSVTKSVTPLVAPLNAGDVITYSFLVENTGNVTINGATPVDSGPTFNGAAATNSLSVFAPVPQLLGPGESQTFTATYSLSQADIDNIAAAADPTTAISNSATADGTPEIGTLPPIDPSDNETGAASNPSVTLVKTSVAPPAPASAGDSITYTFELSNTGNVTIASPIVSDARCIAPGTVLNFTSGFVSGDTGATAQSLDVGETWVFSCTFTISQEDINAGTVQNTATGGGQDPAGNTVEDESDSGNPADDTGANNDPTNTSLGQVSSWTVAKSTASTPSVAGDTLIYEFVVDNTGNVDISLVNLVDIKCAAAPVLVGGDIDSNLILSPTEIFTFECTSIPVTQDEVDDGMADNEVDVIGSVPPSAPPLPVVEDAVSTPIAPASALTIAKSSTPPTTGLGSISTATDEGDTISYSFEVNNTGNVTISSLVINDPGPEFDGNLGTGTWSGVTCPVVTLLPNQTTTCTATYTLSQADIDLAIAAGPDSVVNTAQASGQDPDGTAVNSPSAQETTSIDSDSAIVVLKTSAAPTVINGTDPTLTDPGDTVDFEITVENTGNTTLSNVTVADNLTTVSCAANATPSGAPFVNGGNLAVGDSVVCDAQYLILQTDINNGQVINTGSVSSTDPAGDTVTGVDEATTPFTQKTSLALNKTASVLPVIPAPLPGDLITYTFTLENTGNVTLSDAQIDDPQCEIPVAPLNATNGLVAASDVGADGLLDAGETWTFNCDYALTADDLDINGEVTNTATGSGTPPVDSGLDAPSSTSSAVVKAEQSTAIMLDKVAGIPTTAAGTLPDAADVGDTITFTFNIANTGNITFETVSITDPLITNAPNNGTFSCELNDGIATPFTLDSDPLPAAPAPNSISCTADYTLTQDDIDAGSVANTASAIGNPPGPIPPPPNSSSSAMAPIPPEPSMTIVKSASALPANVVAGTVITYSYLVENTGNVTINNVAPVDLGPTFNGAAGTNNLSAYSPATADLAPGDVQTFTATYVLSQTDIDNMASAADPTTAISNEASADGEPTQGGSVPPVPPSTVETGVAPIPELALTKTSAVGLPVSAGSVLTYTFELENTGNVTISNPVINDSLCQTPSSPLSFTSGFVSGDSGVIAQSLDVNETWVFSCIYIITQADIDAGTVPNTATALGQDPAGGTTSDVSDSGNPGDDTGADNDPTNTSLPRTPSWVIDKSTTSVPEAAGDTLNYTFVLTNTGNTSISAITVSDAKCVGGVANLNPATDIGGDNILSPAGPAGVPPAESWTFSCVSIPVTQAELDSGEVINDVVATGTAPGGGLADATDQEITLAAQTPLMSLVKAAGIATLNNDGSFDQVFDFVLQNTGNVSLNNVTITDNIPAQFGACFVGVAQTGVVSISDAGATGDTLGAALGAAPIIASAAVVGVGDSLLVTGFSVTFDPNAPGCVFPNPAENSASGASDLAADVSDNGSDPGAAGSNDSGIPTPFTAPLPSPEMGIAKSAAILAFNSDFSFDVEYTILLQNTGDVDLTTLSLFDDIVAQTGAAFTPSTAADPSGGILSGPTVTVFTDAAPTDAIAPNLNASFNGGAQNLFDGGSGVLGVDDIIEVRFSIRLDPTAVDPLPETFENTATGSGVAPNGDLAEDNSDDGSDPSTGAGGGGTPTVVSLEDVSSLPIVLGRFTSQRISESQVLIQWQTQTEVANLGFNLYGQVDGEWELLNAEVIPGKGDSVVIVDYEYRADTSANFIAISDIDARGEETLHGPFKVGLSYGASSDRQVTDWTSTSKSRADKKAQREAKRRAQMLERNRSRINQRKAAGE